MNKYLGGFLNIIIGLGILFVGVLFSFNIAVAGFIFFPQIIIGVNQVMVSSPPVWWKGFVPGALPLFFLITNLSFAVLSVVIALKVALKVDIEKIVDVMRKDLKSGCKKKKEASEVVLTPLTQ